MPPTRKVLGLTAALLALVALSGCTGNPQKQVEHNALQGAGWLYDDATDCFGSLHLRPDDDVSAIARRNELCGSPKFLGVPDDEMVNARPDSGYQNWLVRIDDGVSPRVLVLTESTSTLTVGIQTYRHGVAFCWQATLSRDDRPVATREVDCPASWSANWVNFGNPELIHLADLLPR